MTTTVSNRSVQHSVAAIQALDLDAIKFKLMDAKEGEGWSRELADRTELMYRRFLTLVAIHPGETIVPDRSVDKFWHGHILDTLKYAEDCERVFGHFLHHFPYFGMRGTEDAANQAAAVERSARLHRERFGGVPGDAAYCGALRDDQPAYCGAISADEAAYCGAITAEDAAYCGALRDDQPAYCGAVSADKAAYCGAITAGDAAYCGAIRDDQPAYCGAIKRGAAIDSLDSSRRPKLP